MSGANSGLDPGNGITQGYTGSNGIINQAMMAFTAIAWANCIELTVLIFLVFKKYEGVYFWALLLSTLSVIPYSYGAWSKQVWLPYDLPKLLPVAFLNVSWLIMIPGQSLVLWSRLHLITHNNRLLSFILWLIVVNWVIFCIPTTVFTWGSNIGSGPDQRAFLRGYQIYEKVQMTAFSAQEIYISGVYVYEVRRLLKYIYEKDSRKIMWELLAINIFIIVLDVALLVVEFMNLYQVETTFKGMVYSIKLKLEFGVLSKLVKVVLERKDSHGRIRSKEDELALDLEDRTSNAKCTPAPSSPRSRFGSGSTRKESVSTRAGSVHYVENMARDFNLPAEWRRQHSNEFAHRPPVAIPEEQHVKVRPPLNTRDSQFSILSGVAYPGRLNSGGRPND